MSKRKTAEEIIKEKFKTPPSEGYNPVLEAIREGMRQGRDAALEWAAENATTKSEGFYPYGDSGADYSTIEVVNKQSILSGKTHPDLEIK